MTGSGSWVMGIDVGAANTVVAQRYGHQPPEPCEIDGERRMPSLVLMDMDGSLVSGNSAEHLARAQPARAARRSKVHLGVHDGQELASQTFPVTELVANLVRHGYDEAVRRRGTTPAQVRLTYPSGWNDSRVNALVEAARSAGIESPLTVPQALATAAAHAESAAWPAGTLVAVYDLGASCFEAAVCEIGPNGPRLVGSPAGEDGLGGDRLDNALARHIGTRLDSVTWEALQVSTELSWQQSAAALWSEARRVREALSKHPHAEVLVGLPTGMVHQRITRDELDRLAQPVLQRSIELLGHTISSAGVEPSQLGAICVAGAASQTPLVDTMLREAFPGVELSRVDEPKLATALGVTLVPAAAFPAAAFPATSAPADAVPPASDANGSGENVIVSLGGPEAAPAPEGAAGRPNANGAGTGAGAAAGLAAGAAAAAAVGGFEGLQGSTEHPGGPAPGPAPAGEPWPGAGHAPTPTSPAPGQPGAGPAPAAGGTSWPPPNGGQPPGGGGGGGGEEPPAEWGGQPQPPGPFQPSEHDGNGRPKLALIGGGVLAALALVVGALFFLNRSSSDEVDTASTASSTAVATAESAPVTGGAGSTPDSGAGADPTGVGASAVDVQSAVLALTEVGAGFQAGEVSADEPFCGKSPITNQVQRSQAAFQNGARQVLIDHDVSSFADVAAATAALNQSRVIAEDCKRTSTKIDRFDYQVGIEPFRGVEQFCDDSDVFLLVFVSPNGGPVIQQVFGNIRCGRNVSGVSYTIFGRNFDDTDSETFATIYGATGAKLEAIPG